MEHLVLIRSQNIIPNFEYDLIIYVLINNYFSRIVKMKLYLIYTDCSLKVHKFIDYKIEFVSLFYYGKFTIFSFYFQLIYNAIELNDKT